jgi:hypothetical protein
LKVTLTLWSQLFGMLSLLDEFRLRWYLPSVASA